MYAILDIETGGFSITKNGICEIGMIAIDESFNEIDRLQFYIKPYLRDDLSELVSYKEDAMLVNGITIDQLENGIDIELACEKIVSFLNDNKIERLIGHNSDVFDIPRIEYILNRFKGLSISAYTKHDTMKMSKSAYNLTSYSLENLCSEFMITNKNSHSAIGDCEVTLEIFKKLIN